MTRLLKARYVLVAALVVAGAGVLFSYNKNTSMHVSTDPAPVQQRIPRGSYVHINTVYIPAELATSSVAVQRGLSGRESLDQDSGMLFLFSKADIYHFWMPNMRFPLDIIWINDGKVVDITHGASNDFDPAHPVFYTPSVPAQYVLEVNAGFALQEHINTGDSVSLENI